MSAVGDRIGWTLRDAKAVLAGDGRRSAVQLDLDHPKAGLAGCLVGSSPGDPEDGDQLLGLDLHGSARLVDHWARGHDLTAIYQAAQDSDAAQDGFLRTTAMWRPLEGELAAAQPFRAWEVIVSAQTPLRHDEVVLGGGEKTPPWPGSMAPHPAATDFFQSRLSVVCSVAAEAIASGTLDRLANRVGEPRRSVEWSAFAADLRAPRAVAVLARRQLRARDPGSSAVVAIHAIDGGGIAAQIEGTRARIVCPLFGMPLERGVLLRSRVLAAIGPADGDTKWAERLIRDYIALPPMLDT